IAQLAPWLGGGAALANPARAPVKLLVLNVQHSNHEHGRLLRLVAAQNPDVIGLVEVTSRWLRNLKPVRAQYPYHYEVPDALYVGLALYSRLPLENARLLELPGEPWSPAIAATLAAPGGDVEFVLVHPVSPLNAEAIRRRNEQILALARHARAADLPLVMAGDFNATMWNQGYRPLVEVGGLNDARKGHGIGPTWPAIGPLGVPIDHVLATPDVELREFRVLDSVGSDHLPISAEFSTR
ncbi:MAG: endonuclease/exonuclease/phosphatase family protein, partial [Steroidobacteraceae bacterium]